MATTMRSVVLEPLSPQWHLWRAEGIGGSDAPPIAADAGLIVPAKWMRNVEGIWKIKTGQVSGVTAGNWATRKGNRAEPLGRAAFEKETNILLSPIYGEMSALPYIRSSFDGVDFEGNVIGEIKLGSAKVHACVRDNKDVPEYYKPQLAHQALTAWGMPEEWTSEHLIAFISYDIDQHDMQYVMRPALAYRKLAEELLKAEMAFWDMVQQNIDPCGDEWRNAATGYLAISEQIAQLKKEEEKYKVALAELLGSKTKMSGAGVSVTRQDRKGAIDFERIVTEHTKLTEAEIEAYRKGGSSSVVVRAVKD